MKQEIKDVIMRMISKGKRNLKIGKEHLSNQDYDFASSKAYYAVFHFMRAALLTKELTYSKHSAVIAEFNRLFIKENIFPKEFSRQIERLFKERQIGDYDYMESIDKFEAEEDIKISEIICNKIEQYLLNFLNS